MTRSYERGDTLVEMILAFAIFSLAAVGTMAILTSGVAMTQRSLESTLVQQQIDSQAELIRHIHDIRHPLWASLISPGNLTTSPASLDLGGICPSLSDSTPDPQLSRGFFVRPVMGASPVSTTYTRVGVSASTYQDPTTYAKIDYASGKTSALWVQATLAETPPGSVRAYDFYIHACWSSPGLSGPMTTGTIVRLYEK